MDNFRSKSKHRTKRPFSQVETDEDEAVHINKRINHLNIKGARRNSQGQGESASGLPHAQGGAMGPVPLLPTQPMQQQQDHHQYHLPPTAHPVTMGNDAVQQQLFTAAMHQQPFVAAQHPVINADHAPEGPWNPSPPACHSAQFHDTPPSSSGSPDHPWPVYDLLGDARCPALHTAFNVDVAMQDDDEPMNMDPGVYHPELTESDNPHYFQINHVLFQAQCERAKRGGYSVDSGPPVVLLPSDV
ncbi:hypothetical protein ACOMHN_007151 [Nucella lapillus]